MRSKFKALPFLLAVILCVSALTLTPFAAPGNDRSADIEITNITVKSVSSGGTESSVGATITNGGRYRISVEWKLKSSATPLAEDDYFSIPFEFSPNARLSGTAAAFPMVYEDATVGSYLFAADTTGDVTNDGNRDFYERYLLTGTLTTDALEDQNNAAGSATVTFVFYMQEAAGESTAWTIGGADGEVVINSTITGNPPATGTTPDPATEIITKTGNYNADSRIITWSVYMNEKMLDNYANAAAVTITDTMGAGQTLVPLHQLSGSHAGDTVYTHNPTYGKYAPSGDGDAYFELYRMDYEEIYNTVVGDGSFDNDVRHTRVYSRLGTYFRGNGNLNSTQQGGITAGHILPVAVDEITAFDVTNAQNPMGASFAITLDADVFNANFNGDSGKGSVVLLRYCTVLAEDSTVTAMRNHVSLSGRSSTTSYQGWIDKLDGSGNVNANKGQIVIYKLGPDEDGATVGLSGAKFKVVQADSDGNALYTEEIESSANGLAVTKGIGAVTATDTFTITEISPPRGYLSIATSIVVKMDPQNNYRLTILEPASPGAQEGLVEIGGADNNQLAIYNTPSTPSTDDPGGDDDGGGGGGSTTPDPNRPPTVPTTPTTPTRPSDDDSSRGGGGRVDPNRETFTIEEEPVPLANLPELTMIFDGDIPLANNPLTGNGTDMLMTLAGALLLSGIGLMGKGGKRR